MPKLTQLDSKRLIRQRQQMPFNVLPKQSVDAAQLSRSAIAYLMQADAIVGTSIEVANGFANYTNLTDAYNDTPAGGTIVITKDVTLSDSLTISKQISVFGFGISSKLSGSITVATNSTYWTGVNFTGTLNHNAGTNNNVYNDCFFTADPRLTDSGFLNHFSGNIPFEQTEYNNGTINTATLTIGWERSHNQRLTTGSTNITSLTFSNGIPGASYLLKVIQGATPRSITWPASVRWPYSLPPILSGAGKIDLVTFYYDGTNYFGSFVTGY
jgi:hypothetical protein